MDLHLVDTDLASCVQCGLCLPHCPTWRVTGEETASPRGRIAAMRAVQWDRAPADEAFAGYMDACVQCRGCEAACPSAVPFGRLMATTREALVATPVHPPAWRRAAFKVLAHHRLLKTLSTIGGLGQRVGLVPRRLGLPRLPLHQERLHPARTGTPDAWLFTGCVMDAWQRPVHAAALRVMEATGATIALAPRAAACCGALHEHAGFGPDARHLAARVIAAFRGEAPIVVDSAGCGAAMKEYGAWLGTTDARRFAARVVDIHEWLAARMDELPPPVARIAGSVAVQDPCHLRHVQRAHLHVRTVLRPYADLVELDDEGLCCGAGGAYSAFQPALATAIRDRKVEAIARTGAQVVASANPGCALHLAAARVVVRHPVELVAEALGLSPDDDGGEDDSGG
jgi:glycolate oxidase iron-sulfur subunit